MRGLLLLGLLCLSQALAAHSRSQSYSNWALTSAGELSGEFTIDSRRATLLYAEGGSANLPELLASHLADSVTAQAGERPCRARSPVPVPAASGYLRSRLHFACQDSQAVTLEIAAMFRFAATHTHIISVRLPDGSRLERVLTPQQTRLQLRSTAAPAGVWAFVKTGVVHVLSGWDHLAFLAALLALVQGWRARVLTITAFTVGHSLTLMLAVLGVLQPQAWAVEALIGFSVLYAAAQAAGVRGHAVAVSLGALGLLLLLLVWQRSPFSGAGWLLLACALMLPAALYLPDSARSGPLIAGGFGLIHGAGFAGLLLDAQLPEAAVWPALLGFNIGVEAGQLLALCAAMALLAIGARLLPARRLLQARSALLGLLAAVGSYWFSARLLLA